MAYLQRGRVIALDCVNSMKDFVQAKQLVTGAIIVDPALLANANVPLKGMAR